MNHRPNLKARLSDTPDSWEALAVLGAWKRAREMSRNLPRAIKLYSALLQGDLALLEAYFPYIAIALSGNGARPPAPRRLERPAITIAEKDEADDVDDLLDSLGF